MPAADAKLSALPAVANSQLADVFPCDQVGVTSQTTLAKMRAAIVPIVEADITLVDNTTDNVSASKHGFAPKATGIGTKFLDDTGVYDGVDLTTDVDATVLPIANGGTGISTFRKFISNTDTGTQNNWAPGVVGDTVIEWSGAADITVTGIAGGTAYQILTFKNTGSHNAFFPHLSGGSSAGNQLTNAFTSGSVPVASGGYIRYFYDGTNWKLIGHEQGDYINIAFNAGNFTGSGAMTWTVTAGEIVTLQYYVQGRNLILVFDIRNGTIGGTPSTELQMTLPNGFSTSQQRFPVEIETGGTLQFGIALMGHLAATQVGFFTDATTSVNWTAGTANLQIGQVFARLV